MKVFWIIGFIPVELVSFFHSKAISSGGWVQGMCDCIATQEKVSLTLVFKTREKELKTGIQEEKQYQYIGIPANSFSSVIDSVLRQEKPDVIHIWGTEFPITYETLVAAELSGMANRTVISLQGLVSEIWQYLTVGLPLNVQRGATLYELFRHCSISQTQKAFRKRGDREIQCMHMTSVILGRTVWDYACVAKYGLESKYHTCNENLRLSFYHNQWDLDNCEKHSVIVSRGDSPIKGLHRMLPALAILAHRYPDVKLYVAGEDPTYQSDFWRRKLKKQKYLEFIKQQIKDLKLEKRVVFLGVLSESEMVQAYQRANVFALVSTIENSPNSLGEAMLLGMPCVAADVGGTSSMITNEQEGFLCQGDSPAMLAYRISIIFDDSEFAVRLGSAARKRALNTHDPKKNSASLMNVYSSLER